MPRFKATLIVFEVVCSEICAERLKKVGYLLFFGPLQPWFGESGYIKRDHLIRDHWMSRNMKYVVIPRLLHALTQPVAATVITIRPEVENFIEETIKAVAQ